MATRKSLQRAVEVEKILQILHKWGIHTIGQLAALNKDELAIRLGPEAVRMWERANGKSERVLRFVQPPESFEESFEFDHEIETAEPLLFMLRRFLEQLALRLSAIYLVAKELTLRISFSNSRQVRQWTDSSGWRNEPAVAGRQSYERVFKIPQPTNDVEVLFRILGTHLENFRSEHPIIAVALRAEPIKPASQQFGLFETTLRNPHHLSETLARLLALFGSDCVGTPVLEETHRPDAFRMEPFVWQAGTIDLDRPSDETKYVPPNSRLALRRFRPAAQASQFFSETKIAQQRGPYLASGNWWDERAWDRAEWDLQFENGVLCRFYQNDSGCQIEGIYD